MSDNIKKFDGKAKKYSKYRPKYPEKLIDFLINEANLDEQSRVVDMGCGTGILTKQLLERNLDVTGIDPNIEMLNQAKSILNSFKCMLLHKKAENTGLTDNSIDLITVGQALHWFNLEKFHNECQRILKENGRIAILYNHMDLEYKQTDEFINIHRKFCPNYHGFSREIEYTKLFNNEIILKFFSNNQLLSYEEYIGYTETLSYGLNEKDKNYEIYRQALDNVFYKYSMGDRIILPTTTTLILGK